MFNRGGGEIPVPGNDTFTKVLLHFDGANGSTTFTDVNAGGVSGRVWTPHSATISTAQRKFGTGSLRGGPGYISTPASSDLNFGSSNFTIDFWANTNSGTTNFSMGQSGSSTSQLSWSIGGAPGNVFFAVQANPFASVLAQSAGLPSDNNWHHIACVRNGSTFTVYVDGIAGAFPATNSSAVNTRVDDIQIGQLNAPSPVAFVCPVDEFRISVGIARWTANFTPPAGPYN